MARTYLRMTHRVDLYKRVWTQDDYGQKVGNWQETYREAKCYATPSGATSVIRMSPTIEGIDYFNISFPYDTEIDYDTRLYNLVSGAWKEPLYDKPLQIIKMVKYPSYTGKVSYIEVTAKTVIENAGKN